MAGPGDPREDPDADVGFCTPQALAGQAREPEPEPEPVAEPLPEPEPAPEPEIQPERIPEPEQPVAPVQATVIPTTATAPSAPPASAALASAKPADTPSDWRSSLRQAGPTVAERSATKAAPIGGAVGLFGTYVMILLAVPTFGVSAIFGLLSILARPTPSDDVARSHHVFQQRTLVAAAGVAVLGVVLIIVGLGVFVLFALALWMMVRGAVGVLKLKADQPIANPRSWTV